MTREDNRTDDGFGGIEPRTDDDARLVALMLRAKTGDEEAFRGLVEATEDRVYGTIVKMLGGLEGAEDIAQQVYVRMWKARERYEPSAKLSTWMHSIAYRLVLNERRARSRRGAVFAEPQPDSPARDPVVNESPSAQAGASELARAIEQALAELPEDQRTAVVLRRYEEMPYEDIARVLETTVPAVKSLLFRARGALREKLRAWM